jgi:hypothetical protein
MTPIDPVSRDVRLVVLVNRYATPFALLLVIMGIALSQPMGHTRGISIGLLLFSVIFNFAAVPVIRKHSAQKPWLPKMRMAINLAVNVVLVYFLGGYWPPMWLLLALTPIATAIYENRMKTLWAGLGTSFLIVLIHLSRGLTGPYEWGQTLSYSTFIILLSLLVNELTQASFPRHPQEKK